MQNDVLPEALRPLTIHENGSFNFRLSTLMDGQVYDTNLHNPIFKPKRDRRIVTQAPTLENRFSVDFLFVFGDN